METITPHCDDFSHQRRREGRGKTAANRVIRVGFCRVSKSSLEGRGRGKASRQREQHMQRQKREGRRGVFQRPAPRDRGPEARLDE